MKWTDCQWVWFPAIVIPSQPILYANQLLVPSLESYPSEISSIFLPKLQCAVSRATHRNQRKIHTATNRLQQTQTATNTHCKSWRTQIYPLQRGDEKCARSTNPSLHGAFKARTILYNAKKRRWIFLIPFTSWFPLQELENTDIRIYLPLLRGHENALAPQTLQPSALSRRATLLYNVKKHV